MDAGFFQPEPGQFGCMSCDSLGDFYQVRLGNRHSGPSPHIVSALAISPRIRSARLLVGHVRLPPNGISDFSAEEIEPRANARQVTFSWPSLRLAQSATSCPDRLCRLL
jgi:hypothetical protein